MPPKKKGSKKAQQDDWEADLGETIAPQESPAETPAPEEAAADEDSGAGGLLASLQRRSKKKGKKNQDQDFVEGEDPPVDLETAIASKAPEEGTFDDDDVFAGNANKKKGKGAQKKEEPKEEPADDGAPRVKTKAEKEKEKKEKEKERKKALVRLSCQSQSIL